MNPSGWEGATGADLRAEVVGFAEAVEAVGSAEDGETAVWRSIGSLVVFGTAGAARWMGMLENQGSCMFDGVGMHALEGRA